MKLMEHGKDFEVHFFLNIFLNGSIIVHFVLFLILDVCFFSFFPLNAEVSVFFAAWYLCKPAPVALGLKRFSFRVHTVTLKLGEIHQTPPFLFFLFFSFCSFFNYSQKCMGRKKNVK